MEVNLNYGISSANELFGLFLQFISIESKLKFQEKKNNKYKYNSYTHICREWSFVVTTARYTLNYNEGKNIYIEIQSIY